MLAFFPRWRESASRNKSIGEGLQLSTLNEWFYVKKRSFIKNQIPGKQVPSESLLLELFSLKVVK